MYIRTVHSQTRREQDKINYCTTQRSSLSAQFSAQRGTAWLPVSYICNTGRRYKETPFGLKVYCTNRRLPLAPILSIFTLQDLLFILTSLTENFFYSVLFEKVHCTMIPRILSIRGTKVFLLSSHINFYIYLFLSELGNRQFFASPISVSLIE